MTTTTSALSDKKYRGITDPRCLRWCHGTTGVEHDKMRVFRYPLWKYAHFSRRTVVCICRNCQMQFVGDETSGVPLNIPVTHRDGFFAHEIAVQRSGQTLPLRGEIIRPFRRITQSMLTIETRRFIDLVQ